MADDIQIIMVRHKYPEPDEIIVRHDGSERSFLTNQLGDFTAYMATIPNVLHRNAIFLNTTPLENEWLSTVHVSKLHAQLEGLTWRQYLIREFARMTGKKGGSSKSDDKIRASKMNGAKGGRPKKKPPEPAPARRGPEDGIRAMWRGSQQQDVILGLDGISHNLTTGNASRTFVYTGDPEPVRQETKALGSSKSTKAKAPKRTKK